MIPKIKIDGAQAKKEAAAELRGEQVEEAKIRFKEKLSELADAEKMVANIQREIEDLEAELSGE
jgi:hypothetical protein